MSFSQDKGTLRAGLRRGGSAIKRQAFPGKLNMWGALYHFFNAVLTGKISL